MKFSKVEQDVQLIEINFKSKNAYNYYLGASVTGYKKEGVVITLNFKLTIMKLFVGSDQA